MINIFIHHPRQSVHECLSYKILHQICITERETDGLASFTPHDIVCKCLIIEKAERPEFRLEFSCFNDLFSEPKLSRIIFDQ